MQKKSETFYESIIDGKYDPRLKKSITNIKTACDEIEGYGGTITISVVGKFCQNKYKGPTAQSISNKPETLKQYVDLRCSEQVIPARQKHDDIKMKISDPKTRFYIAQIEEELNSCTKQNQRLKNFIKHLAPVEMDDMIAQAFGGNSVNEDVLSKVFLPKKTNHKDKFELSVLALQALEKITSEEYLRAFGLKLYKGHLLLASTNKTLLEKEEFSALLELLENEEPVTSQTKLLNGETDASQA